MIIGDRDKEGNTLILGAWKARLFLTPEGAYLIDNQITLEEEMALDLYNSLNFTSLKSLPRTPKLRPGKLQGIRLPNTDGRILGAFESESSLGTFHFVIEPLTGSVYCTCFGFRAPNNCWHYRSIIEIGPENIPETIRVNLIRKE